jgi:hypothetical protein
MDVDLQGSNGSPWAVANETVSEAKMEASGQISEIEMASPRAVYSANRWRASQPAIPSAALEFER